MSAEVTFPRLLADLARIRPDDVALQEKRYGIWQPTTWRKHAERVADFAHGLAELGVRRGDVVAVIGDNRPEWLITELASQSLGAAVVGVYPTSINEEVRHVLEVARVEIVVAEDQEQVDKVLRLADELPLLRAVIYYVPQGLEDYDHALLHEFTAVERSGRAWGTQHPGWLQEQVDAADPGDTAVICTTSGTTNKPKLAALSHHNLLAMAEHLLSVDPLDAGDRYVSFLPFAWIGEQMLAVACGLARGFTISFPEASATQRADLRAIGPDVMFGPPRIWDSMLSDVQVRIDEAGWLKRAVFAWGYRVGDRVATLRVSGRRPGAGLALADRVAQWVALRPIRDQLGLLRVKRCYTGGAPLGPDVFQFFHAIGVNLKQIYGQTEICGLAVVHSDDDVRFSTVGRPIPGTEVAIAEDGEILLRSDSVFRGYVGNAEATQGAVDDEGWLHTGDAGFLEDDGHLVVIDRAKDVLTAPDGTRFSSAFIENKLKFSPYVEETVVFGGQDGAAVVALVTIDPSTVGAWAEHQRLSYTTYTDLAAQPDVRALLAEEVHRANQSMPGPVQVRRFCLLHKQFDPDDDEITRTRKVRRNVISQRYGDIVAALHDGSDQVEVRSLVTYQDGSSAERVLTLHIVDLTGYQPPRHDRERPVWSGRR